MRQTQHRPTTGQHRQHALQQKDVMGPVADGTQSRRRGMLLVVHFGGILDQQHLLLLSGLRSRLLHMRADHVPQASARSDRPPARPLSPASAPARRLPDRGQWRTPWPRHARSGPGGPSARLQRSPRPTVGPTTRCSHSSALPFLFSSPYIPYPNGRSNSHLEQLLSL